MILLEDVSFCSSSFKGVKKKLEKTHILDLFYERIQSDPHAVALICDKKNVSYSALNRMADNIAKRLIQSGCKKGDILCLCMGREIEVVAGMLAVFKIGGVYLPIDPELPKDRIENILRHSQCEFVLVTSDTAEYPSKTVINICDLPQNGVSDPFFNLSSNNINQTAYVIYTSGSTGNPKGVAVSHFSLANLLQAFQGITGIGPQDRFLAVTTISFDISLLEILLPLVSGATIVLGRKRLLIDPAMMIEALAKYNITIMQATPITWDMMIQSGWENSSRIKILCGGDALTEKTFQELLRITDFAWNVYGPTETTIWSSAAQFNKEDGIHIGTPLLNTEFHVYTEDGAEAKEGDIGELYIGGAGVAQGYLNDPEQTQTKFIYKTSITERLYKTGDIVSITHGKIRFVGRNDFQVKINGHRVELEEIQNHILSLQEIDNVQIILRGSDKKMIAFLKTSNAIPKKNEILDFLRSKLPPYMIPFDFIKIDEWPLTYNNKIDRKKLVAISEQGHASHLETGFLGIVQNHLKISSIDKKKTLYQLGADSLTMVYITMDLNKIGLTLDPFTLYRSIAVGELDEQVQKSKLLSQRVMQHNESAKEYSLYNLQRPMIQHSHFYPESDVFFEKVTLDFQGCINEAFLKECTDYLCANLDVLRTVYKYRKGLREINDIPPNINFMYAANDSIYDKLYKDVGKKAFNRNEFLSVVPFMLTAITSEKRSSIHILYHHAMMDGVSSSLYVRLLVNCYKERSLSGEIKISLDQYNSLEQAIAILSGKEEKTALEFFQMRHGRQAEKQKIFEHVIDYGHDPHTISLIINPADTTQLQNYCKNKSVTLSSLFQFLIAGTMLHLYPDKFVDYALASSNRIFLNADTFDCIGNIVNIIPLTIDKQELSHLESFHDLYTNYLSFSYLNYEKTLKTPSRQDFLIIVNHLDFHPPLESYGDITLRSIKRQHKTEFPLMFFIDLGAEINIHLSCYDPINSHELNEIRRIIKEKLSACLNSV